MSDHSNDDTWFDRELCPPPCDTMHERYGCCGAPVEDCAHDSSQHREVATLAELLQTRGILLDLIADLRGYQEDLDATERALDAYGECLCDVAGQAGLCTMHNPRRVVNMADRAEARLREVSGDE